MFRNTEDPSSGSLVQCLAKNCIYILYYIILYYILYISWIIKCLII